MCPSTLLIVDDDRDFSIFVAKVASDVGFAVGVATSGDACLGELQRRPRDVLFIDLQMPDMDGVQLMRRLALQGCKSRLLLASGIDPRTLASARRLAIELGLDVVATVQKPVRLTEIRGLLTSLNAMPQADDEPSERALANAIDKQALTLAYQPMIDLRSKRVVGVEALARWTLASGLPVPPDRFIAIAETSGLIDRLTHHVLDQAVRQAAVWAADGLDLRVAVNLSVASLHDLEFPDKLADRCADACLSPDRIRLELTETATMQSSLPMMDILTRIRLKGFELSLDDFGVGYSSLKQLLRLPFNELKIDRSFIGELQKTSESAVITKTIVDMTHNLGMTVVAEGIEDGAALELLDEYGCDCGQGYFFCRPVRGEEIATAVQAIDRAFQRSSLPDPAA